MLALIVLGLLGVIYFVFYGSVNDPEVIRQGQVQKVL